MASLLLVMIYITFIGLGLPDSILGAAWPVMYQELGADVGAAGLLTMVVAGGTVVSSLFSDVVIRRLGVGKVTLVSVLATAAALLGFSFAPGLVWLILLAIPLGLGAGAIDSGLNNYVALHYKPHHMSWLHCFWGIGAFTGPFVVAACLGQGGGWRQGYFIVAAVQFAIVIALFFFLPRWGRAEAETEGRVDEASAPQTVKGAPARFSPFRIPGAAAALIGFMAYSTVEITVNCWGASYLVETRGQHPATAARWISLFFLGITLGRLAAGFLTIRFSNRSLIRLGQVVLLTGALLLALPLPGYAALGGIVLVGLGCAPVFPCMLHETPNRFGAELSQKIMGLQMATAYTASTFVPLAVGFVASKTGFGFLPFFLIAAGLVMLLASEQIGRVVEQRNLKACPPQRQ